MQQDLLFKILLKKESFNYKKKKLVFDGIIGGDATSMAKLTVDDMRFYFNNLIIWIWFNLIEGIEIVVYS